MDDDFNPTAEGLVQCLRALCEEAAYLSLTRTFAALQDAVATCCAEANVTRAALGERVALALLH
ncbi:MAG: hypothetical protein NVSMB18_27190 [Acetobacteraceae bacterium]